MTDLAIRRAAAADIVTVVRILNEANEWIAERGHRPWNQRPWRAADAEPRIGGTYLAFDGDVPIATVIIQSSDEALWPDRPADALYVHRLAVARAAHGRNVGGELLEFAARTARAAGKQHLRLDCHCDNPQLQGYYRRKGFTYLGEVRIGTPPRDYCATLFEKPL